MPDGPGRDVDTEARLLAAAAREFAQFPGAVVRVVARGSDNWKKYAGKAARLFQETDETQELLARGLPGSSAGGKRTNPVWSARQAAADALGEGSEAEYAVIAAAGDSDLFTVATFARTSDDLRVLGAGTTHPGIGSTDVSETSVPAPGQLGDAVRFGLTRIAARGGRGMVEQVPADRWLSARPRPDRLTVIGQDGGWRASVRGSRWTADEVRRLSAAAGNWLPRGQSPFRAVDQQLGAAQWPREYAELARNFLDRGGRIQVMDQGVAGDPDRILGARTLVAEVDGVPGSTLTFGRNSDGDLRVLESTMTGSEADRGWEALWVTAQQEAHRLGVGMLSKDGAYFSADRVSSYACTARDLLGARVDDLPRVGWATDEAPDPEVTAAVAAAIGRFRDGRTDVLILEPHQPQFTALREQVAGLMAESISGNGAADERLAGMWAAFNPKEIQQKGAAEKRYRPGTAVAVALDANGAPVAAAGFRAGGLRVELGPVGSSPGAGDDATAAVLVDGVFGAADGRPVGGYLPEPMAQAYGTVGAQVGAHAAVNAPWLTGIEMGGTAVNQVLEATDEVVTGLGPRDISEVARRVEQFQNSGGTFVVLDHATESGRRQAEKAAHIVRGDSGAESPGPIPLPGRQAPEIRDGSRAGTAHGEPGDVRASEASPRGVRPAAAAEDARLLTVVAHVGGEPRAFVTLEATPGTVRAVESGGTDLDRGAAVSVNYAVGQYLTINEVDGARSVAPRSGGGMLDAEAARQLAEGVQRRLGRTPPVLSFRDTTAMGKATEQERPAHRRTDAIERRQVGGR